MSRLTENTQYIVCLESIGGKNVEFFDTLEEALNSLLNIHCNINRKDSDIITDSDLLHNSIWVFEKDNHLYFRWTFEKSSHMDLRIFPSDEDKPKTLDQLREFFIAGNKVKFNWSSSVFISLSLMTREQYIHNEQLLLTKITNKLSQDINFRKFIDLKKEIVSVYSEELFRLFELACELRKNHPEFTLYEELQNNLGKNISE